MYSLSLIIGLSAVGYIQAANTLVEPSMVLFMGTTMVGFPKAPGFCVVRPNACCNSALW